ncbi:MAG TPA: hypothetical protein VNZ44_10315 [Pyrinomonadaceae bacterium]|nr:hypothetical protein [Pyrinomonadaceae bacterium]
MFVCVARRALVCAALSASAGLATTDAQSGRAPTNPQRPPREVRSSTMRVELPSPVAETPVPFIGDEGRGQIQTLSFVTPDTNFERRVVKGAPFSADAVTENVQRLGDGNRMVRKSEAKLFRDGEGRTRREHKLTRGGPSLAPDGEEPRLIVINDPVIQVNYVADTGRGTIRRMILPPGLEEARRRAMGDENSFGVLMPTSTAHRRMAEPDAAAPLPEPKKERLEAQLVEGVMAEGTRITVTIPAGEFDNEQPMEITHEQWYSPELQTVVLMKHNDPRFGETTYRLTNITRAEPAPELFKPPTGLRLLDQHDPALTRRPLSSEPPALRRPGVNQ